MKKSVNSGTFALPEVFSLTVDYSKTFDEMVMAGRYDWKDRNVTVENFPISGEGVVEFDAFYFRFRDQFPIHLEHCGWCLKRKIRETNESNPWSSAKIEHVLALGAAYPDEQRKHPIIGLGSIARIGINLEVPCIYEFKDSRRYLCSGWWAGERWFSIARFLAVRSVRK